MGVHAYECADGDSLGKSENPLRGATCNAWQKKAEMALHYIITSGSNARWMSMTIKAARLKDHRTVHPENTGLTMAVRALGVVLLFSFVTTLLGLPTTVPGEGINYTLNKKEGTRSLQLHPLRDLLVRDVFFFLDKLNDVSRVRPTF